tara:strand:- start:23829 stop:24293 length:465 start_codon:yes stop_codon:yes gene_type:complete
MISNTNIFGVTPMKSVTDEIINSVSNNDVFGVKYPLYDKNNSAKGIFIKTKGFELVKSELRQFIKTERGERVMLPNFGLSLKRFLFEPITEDLIISMKKEIIIGVNNYLPSVRILRLDILKSDKAQGFGLPGLMIRLLVASKLSEQQSELSISL